VKRLGYIKRTPLRYKKKEPRVERIPLAIPRPGEMKKEPVAVKVFRDGREQCNLLCKEGADEYQRRKWAMRDRQKNRCCLEGIIPDCPGFLAKVDTTFEHEFGRTGGKRDDRIERPNPETGEMEWINGASHFWCNSKKGSRRITYNDAP